MRNKDLFKIRTVAGQPFFWLGDTAWELFHRLDREEAMQYLNSEPAYELHPVNPGDGSIMEMGVYDTGRIRQFDPPGEAERGNDWVLLIDEEDTSVKSYRP